MRLKKKKYFQLQVKCFKYFNRNHQLWLHNGLHGHTASLHGERAVQGWVEPSGRFNLLLSTFPDTERFQLAATRDGFL